MATLLTIKNADFSANAIGFAPPVASGLLGWFFLGGGSAAAVQKDFAFLSNGVITGAPTFGAGFTTFAGGASGQAMLTNIAETNDLTAFVVGRTSDTLAGAAHQPVLLTNYTSNGSANVGMTMQVAGPDSGGAPGATVAGYSWVNNAGSPSLVPAQLDVPGFNAFKCLAYTVSTAAGSAVMANLTNGTSISGAFSLARFPNAVVKYRIGSSVAGGTGSCDIAFVAVYNRALSTVEQQTVYAFVKNYLNAKYGITV